MLIMCLYLGYEYLRTPMEAVLGELIRPHLLIYLDAPVSHCRELIEKRGRVNIVNWFKQYFIHEFTSRFT